MRILQDLRDLRQEHDEEMLHLRIAALNEWSGQTADHDRQYRRNTLAHGGAVRADVKVIKRYGNNPCVGPWKDAFFKQYGVPFNLLEGQMDRVPSQLVEVLDHRANARRMDIWRTPQNQQRRLEVISNANEIIKEWHQGSEDLFKDGSRRLQLYKTMEEEYLLGIQHM
jgi:hypothetical protein